jgi:hypothetical protein
MVGGYVGAMEDSLRNQAAVDIVQISVGGTSSLTAVGRIFELFGSGTSEAVDIVLYEYSINDNGHFAWRPDLAHTYLLCLDLVIRAAAKFLPGAVFVPLIFASKHSSSTDIRDPFYELQTSLFSALSLPCIDVRKWLHEKFAGRLPDWLYSDPFHYAIPDATSMIGAYIASRVQDIHRNCCETLSITDQRLGASSPFSNLEVLYVPGQKLSSVAHGPWRLDRASNSAMDIEYLRLLAGGGLSIASKYFPLVLYLKSDAHHGLARLTLSGPDGQSTSFYLGTRHADTAQFPFVYTSIPLPLVLGNSMRTRFWPTTLTIAVDKQQPAAEPIGQFDCFDVLSAQAPDPYVDLAGILFVGQRS